MAAACHPWHEFRTIISSYLIQNIPLTEKKNGKTEFEKILRHPSEKK